MEENGQSSSDELSDTSIATRGANVSCRNQNNYMKLIRERLDRENMQKFRDSCFGQFIDVDTKKPQGQLVYLLYKHLDLNAIQRRRLGFIINGRHLELGPAEYFLITGLRFSGWEKPPSCSKIHNKIFGGKDQLFVKDIYKAFDDFSLKKKDKGKTVLKLALLLVLYGTLLVRHQTSKLIEVQYLHLVDDLKKFNNYPWGLVSYQLLVTASYNTKLRIDETLPEKQPAFDVFGFTFALQVFAYEVHRDLAVHCAKAIEGASKTFPRMLRWSTNKFYHFSAILQYFGMSHASSVESMEQSDEERLLLASNEIDYDMICHVPIEKILQHCKVVKAKSLTALKRKRNLGGSVMQKKQKVKLKGKVEVNGKENSKFEQVRCSGSPSFDVHCSQRRAFVSDGSPSFHVGSSKRRTFEEASSGFDDEIPTGEDVSSDRALKLMKLLLDKFASLQSEVGEMRGDIKTLKNVGRCRFRNQSFNEEMTHGSMVDPSTELQSYVYRDEHDPSTRTTYDLFGDLKLQDVVVKQAEKKVLLNSKMSWAHPFETVPSKSESTSFFTPAKLSLQSASLQSCFSASTSKQSPVIWCKDNEVPTAGQIRPHTRVSNALNQLDIDRKKAAASGLQLSPPMLNKTVNAFAEQAMKLRSNKCGNLGIQSCGKQIVDDFQSNTESSSKPKSPTRVTSKSCYSALAAMLSAKDRPYPLITVSPDSIAKFDKWYRSNIQKGEKSETIVVPRDPKASPKWIHQLWSPHGWLSSSCLDSLVDMVLITAKELPHLFIEKWAVLDQQGWQAICGENLDYSSSRIFDYVNGKLPYLRPTPWNKVNKIFGIAYIPKKHWACYEVNFAKQEIIVYDSSSQYVEAGRDIQSAFQNVAVNVPSLLGKDGLWDLVGCGSKLRQRWHVLVFQHPPQQPNNHDCGLLSVKFLECLATGHSVSILWPPNINQQNFSKLLFTFRKSMCVEMKNAAETGDMRVQEKRKG